MHHRMMATLMTNAKLEILHSRDMHIKSVMADVNIELMKTRCNKKHYKHILKMLILQAMYQVMLNLVYDLLAKKVLVVFYFCTKLLEEDVNLIVISHDVKYVRSIIGELQKTYEANTGMTVNINIEKHLRLPIEEIGGVMITSKNRRIVVENTLVMRLLYLGHLAIPIIRCGLFGPNPNRIY